MDDDFGYELEEVLKNVDTAEVMSLFFPNLRQAIVIDARSSDTEGPMVRLLPMVASPQERLRSIHRMRPNFPRLNSLTLIPWPRYVDSLVSMGVWERLVRRFQDAGHREAVAACGVILEELRRLEKLELASVVRGENYHTVWSARPPP
jgi:hypothetical protein